MGDNRIVLRLEAKDSTEEAIVLMKALALHTRNKYDCTGITTTVTAEDTGEDKSQAAAEKAKAFIKAHKKEILQFLK